MKQETVTKNYLGQTFSFQTLVSDEGHVLWDNRVDNEFNLWLENLSTTHPELFQHRIEVPESTLSILNQIRNFLQLDSLDALLPKLVQVYINRVDGRITPYKFPEDSILKPLILTFKPQDLKAITSIANLTQTSVKEVLELSLVQISELANTENKDHATFWGKTILPEILRELSI